MDKRYLANFIFPIAPADEPGSTMPCTTEILVERLERIITPLVAAGKEYARTAKDAVPKKRLAARGPMPEFDENNIEEMIEFLRVPPPKLDRYVAAILEEDIGSFKSAIDRLEADVAFVKSGYRNLIRSTKIISAMGHLLGSGFVDVFNAYAAIRSKTGEESEVIDKKKEIFDGMRAALNECKDRLGRANQAEYGAEISFRHGARKNLENSVRSNGIGHN